MVQRKEEMRRYKKYVEGEKGPKEESDRKLRPSNPFSESSAFLVVANVLFTPQNRALNMV